MDKYMWFQELIFHFSRDVSLGRLCSNFLMASATTTLINLTPAPRVRKIVCKHVLFFDHGWAGYLTYLGSPTRQKNMRSLLIFRNGEWLRNSTLNWCFPISENVRQIQCSPSVKLRKNTKFIASYPAPGKYQWIACSPERFSIVFPCARTRHFPSVFPQNN